LAVMDEREYCTWVADVPATERCAQGLKPPTKPPSEGLQLLRQFCDTGAWPESERDAELLAKEVLYYRLVDAFAQVKNKGLEVTTRDKSVLPLVVQLVRV
jgi:hypothetical protein